MKKEDAQALIRELIKSGEKHSDYDTVVKMADKNKILMTGKNTSKLLRCHVTTESPLEFAQRCAITKSITPAVLASAKKPFYKVARNQRIKRNIEVKSDKAKTNIENMIAGFYGSAKRKNKGLDYWMKSRFMDLSFKDPNAWVVLEWDTPADPTEIVIPRPFIVRSSQAVNFRVINDEIYWLLVELTIKYKTIDAAATNQIKLKEGKKFTLYESDFTIIYEQVDRDYFQTGAIPLAPNQAYIDNADEKIAWIETINEPKIGFTPAIRVGYNRDLSTDERTFVAPYEDAMCYLDKCIKVVSEMDISMTKHVFPQKIQYAPPCPGTRERKCNGGRIMDGSKCEVCDGTGFSGHKSGMDVLNLPMPIPGTPNN